MSLKDTLYLRAFSFFKIPLLFYVGPSVVETSLSRTEIKIGLGRRTRNHLGAMYFGVLAAGADCAAGLSAMRMIEDEKTKSGRRVDLIFKDFHADFFKRAEGDVHFVCTQGPAIADLVKQALSQPDRVTMPVEVLAYVPKDSHYGEPIGKFTLGLSLKARPPK